MSTWLSTSGPFFLKRHVKHSKYEPLIDEVEVIDSNPLCAHIHICSSFSSLCREFITNYCRY